MSYSQPFYHPEKNFQKNEKTSYLKFVLFILFQEFSMGKAAF